MYTDTEKNEFVALRAEGLSFDKISSKMGIPKLTLIRWSREKKNDIDSLKEAAFESILESLKIDSASRLQMLSEDLNKINNTLKKDSLSYLSLSNKLNFKIKLINEISKFDSANRINGNIEADPNSEKQDDKSPPSLLTGETILQEERKKITKKLMNIPGVKDYIASEKQANKSLNLFDNQNDD